MCKKLINETWHCWVPTNLGTLSYDFVTHSQIKKNFGHTSKYSKDDNCKRFYDLNLKSIIDSLPSYLTSKKNHEENPMGVITINNSLSLFEGTVLLNYKESFQIEFEYTVEHNGKTKIFNTKYTIKDENLELPEKCNDTLFDTFAQIAYMIIKYSLHGDNHHHQKIDYVLQVKRHKFSVKNIIDTFGKHIKNVERDIKSLSTCTGHLKAINSIEEVQGYISYVNTFHDLYRYEIQKDSSSSLKIKAMNNVLISLKSTVTKKDNRFKYMDNAKTIFLTIIALVVSLSLFLFNIYSQAYTNEKTISCNISNNYSNMECNINQNKSNIDNFSTILNLVFQQDWYMNILLLSIIVISIFILLKWCYISSWVFYNQYDIYEDYKHLSWLSIMDSSFKHIILKLGIPLLIISVSIYFFYKTI